VSADGRYVAFASYATNLVNGDTNGSTADIFVRDRQSGTTTRVSVRSNGAQANDTSLLPRMSFDGRFVAFMSNASNLVGGDTNHTTDVFVHDRQSGTTARMSISSGEVEGNGTSSSPSISADGRYVAFYSDATNLIGGDANGFRTDIFIRDRQNGTTECASFSSSGEQGNHNSVSPSLSADGRYVAFYGFADNLVSGDTNNVYDVFLRDRMTGIGWEYCTANVNSTGSPADLSASGSASSGAGDLTLTSAPVPNQNGIFFHGMNQSQLPFGNGFMCTTGGIARGAVIQAAANVAAYTYDNSDAKHGLAGFVNTTRNFQYWFRDPMGGGALFNTSSAISIPVLP
jgi:Tol biopolymer transport system component